METLVKHTESLLQQLTLPFSNIVLELNTDFQVVVISVATPEKLSAIDIEDVRYALAHVLREITRYEEFPIIVDINGAEIKKLRTLQQTIHILADRVRNFERSFDFPSASSFERMLVHGYVSRSLPDLRQNHLAKEKNGT